MSAAVKAALLSLVYLLLSVGSFVRDDAVAGWGLLLFGVMLSATSLVCDAIEKSKVP